MVWQLDFSEFETVGGGTWRIAACTDYWSKVELGWHLSLTANQHDAVAAIELALAEHERLFGRPLVQDCPVDPETGELLPVVTIVTDIQARWAGLGCIRRPAGEAELVRHLPATVDDRAGRVATSCLLITWAGGATAGGRAPC